MQTQRSIDEVLTGTPYRDYLYSYPHKTAYRKLEPSRSLASLWTGEDKTALFLYIHIPFCEMRCGFCNLFTTPKPDADPVREYILALERQAHVVRDAMGSADYARMAIGGGTPTYLDPDQLHRVFDVAETLGVDLGATPISVETSPETGSLERLNVLKERGVTRVSIGVQSFLDSEVRSVGRAQKRFEVEQTLETIRKVGFSTLNIDLMYGIAGQTEATWFESLDRAVGFAAEEIYLYPLYVRPLTGLGRQSRSWDDTRLAFYRSGRDRLLAAGYVQVSMRMFRRTGASDQSEAAEYVCQRDGMVGLGVGARSYTDSVHYSSEYAVANRDVKSIIAGFIEAGERDHASTDHGIELDAEDRRRRFAILSLLATSGLSLESYRERFGSEPADDIAEIAELVPAGLAEEKNGLLVLTPLGLERSDAIGPILRSNRVDARMTTYQHR